MTTQPREPFEVLTMGRIGVDIYPLQIRRSLRHVEYADAPARGDRRGRGAPAPGAPAGASIPAILVMPVQASGSRHACASTARSRGIRVRHSAGSRARSRTAAAR